MLNIPYKNTFTYISPFHSSQRQIYEQEKYFYAWAKFPLDSKEYLLKTIKESSIISWQHINLHGEYDFTSAANDSVFNIVFELDKIKELKVA